MAVLEAQGIDVRFGQLQAVRDLDLVVEPGEIIGLIGPNGAGKTTAFNAISGVQECSGTVKIAGKDVTKEPPQNRARLGMSRTFQRLEVFGSMSAYDNIRTAAEIIARGRRESMKGAAAKADELIEMLGLESVRDRRADALPTGQARLVELGRALATDPKVVLLDEPASGLDDLETRGFADVLRMLQTQGIGVLFVEHDIDLVMELCTRIYVLNLGEVIAAGEPHEIQKDPNVQAAYLGNA